jgi:cytidylate kinase
MANTTDKDLIIAIDGHSSCGKSTFAKQIALLLGYTYIDSGAMYRAVTLYFLQNNMISGDTIDKNHLNEVLYEITIGFQFNLRTGKSETFLNNENIEEEIRNSADVANNVSNVSKIREVRLKLVEIQRQMGKNKRIVMDGRDIGTVVFPGADIKIFMTADPDVRAQRRYDELVTKGIETTLTEVKNNLMSRDEIDQNRKESPLRKPDDAVVLDNSKLTREGQLEWFKDYLKIFLNPM